MYPTNQELENAAIAAETGVWTDEHKCANNYQDCTGASWPGQCLVSLAETEYDAIYSNFKGVIWLGESLPDPYKSMDDWGNFRYTLAIDNGKGKEVATAIRSLKN